MNLVIDVSGPNLADRLAYPVFGTQVNLLKNSNPRAGILLCSARDPKAHCNRVREGPGGKDHINNVSFWVVNKTMQTTLADILKNVVELIVVTFFREKIVK
jgi:hypothetical protein